MIRYITFSNIKMSNNSMRHVCLMSHFQHLSAFPTHQGITSCCGNKLVCLWWAIHSPTTPAACFTTLGDMFSWSYFSVGVNRYLHALVYILLNDGFASGICGASNFEHCITRKSIIDWCNIFEFTASWKPTWEPIKLQNSRSKSLSVERM